MTQPLSATSSYLRRGPEMQANASIIDYPTLASTTTWATKSPRTQASFIVSSLLLQETQILKNELVVDLRLNMGSHPSSYMLFTGSLFCQDVQLQIILQLNTTPPHPTPTHPPPHPTNISWQNNVFLLGHTNANWFALFSSRKIHAIPHRC